MPAAPDLKAPPIRVAPQPLLTSDSECQAIQGKARADVAFAGKIYRAAGLCAVSIDTATVGSKDGQIDVPIDALPVALRDEASAWQIDAATPAATY